MLRGTSAASRYFSRKLDERVTKSTVHSIKTAYLREKKMDKDPTILPTKKRGRPLLLGDTVDAQLQVYLKTIREQGGVVTASLVVAAAKGILKAIDRCSLLEYGGYINPTKDWAYHFLARMQFVRRKATTAKSKVSALEFNQLRDDFFSELFSIVTMEEIPPELVLNWDQTGIHLVPAAAWTMAERGSKRVEIDGVNDKRQITAVFCGSLIGEFLPVQIIYKGKTERCHPQFQFPLDWNVTHSPKHWSTEDTMIEYISEIIVPFVESVRSRLNEESAAAVVIMDNFKGQKTPRVMKLLEENKLHVCLLPPNTTDKLQPMDVAVNKPAKNFLRTKFEDWYANQVMNQLPHAGGASDIELYELQPVNLSMVRMKQLSAQWLVEMHDYITAHPEFIVNGFIRSGITKALSDSMATDTSEDDSDPETSTELFSDEYDSDDDYDAEFSDEG